MPEISRFYGIVVTMYYNDHEPPHFHAKYAEDRAKIAIANGAVLDGRLSKRALALVEIWRGQHVEELLIAWAAVMSRHPVGRIAPLD